MTPKFSPKVARDALKALDHLLLGIADLERGVTWMQEKSGVKAMIGGCHPSLGTQNALVSFGNLQYLEIISRDPRQKQTGRTAALLQNLIVPQLIAWAVSIENVDALSRQARAAGYEIEGPTPGKRDKPDGGILKWRTVRILSRFEDMIPFFIEWDSGTMHPSKDSPAGCSLEAFFIEHPEPDPIGKMLLEFEIKATVNHSTAPRLKAILSTPKGLVEL